TDGGSAIFDTLASAVVRAASPGFRRLIVLLTDGRDTSSFISREDRLALVDRAEAVVHVVSTTYHSDAGGTRLPLKAQFVGDFDYQLQELADRSGGRLFNLSRGESIPAVLKNLIDEFRTRFVLRFVPTGVAEKGWHSLSVTVTSGQYDVKA